MAAEVRVRDRWPTLVVVVVAAVIGASIFGSELSLPVRVMASVGVGVVTALLAGVTFRLFGVGRSK